MQSNIITPEELVRLFADREAYLRSFIKIENKQRETVPFIANEVQAQFIKNKTGRDIILKARQLGFTSIIMANFLVDCITIPGTVSVVVSHEEFNTQRLLKKARFYYDSIPEAVKPALGHGSSYEMTWPKLNSTFYIGTARATVFGRGDTIHNFLGSEISRWPNPERIMTAVANSVPDIGGTIILESTPNGEGNYFHMGCMQAMKGNSPYKLHFFPWWLCRDYQLPEDSPAALPSDRYTPLVYTIEEQDLARRHQLIEAQIRWRRMKVADMAFGKEDGTMVDFQEEYPEDSEACFLTSGEKRLYSHEVLDGLMYQCRSPSSTTIFGLDIWIEPKSNHVYVIGADPSGGVVDPAAAVVWDITSPMEPKFCATLHGLYEPRTFATKLYQTGKLYNWAKLAVERNGPGLAVIVLLRGDINYSRPEEDNDKSTIYSPPSIASLNYPNLYRQHDPATGRRSTRPGWNTSNPSKNVMAASLGRHLQTAEIQDRRILTEVRAMRRDSQIVFSFAHDDLWAAASIGLSVIETAGAGVSSSRRYGWNW